MQAEGGRLVPSPCIDSCQQGAACQDSNHCGSAKRIKLDDNPSLSAPSAHPNREIEVEVDQLRSELEVARKELKEKSVEVEKSTQLFNMFD